MSKKIIIYKETLQKDQRIIDPIIDLYDLEDNILYEHGWLYNNYWPTDKFKNLIDYIMSIHPMLIMDDPKFWDMGLQGYDVYNHCLDELSQKEGIEY